MKCVTIETSLLLILQSPLCWGTAGQGRQAYPQDIHQETHGYTTLYNHTLSFQTWKISKFILFTNLCIFCSNISSLKCNMNQLGKKWLFRITKFSVIIIKKKKFKT